MQGLRESGWREGQNLHVERREGGAEMVDSFAADLVRLRVDAIVTFTTAAGRAAHRATQSIPIVMALYSGDPVADGLAVSLGRPGGNVTGLLTGVPGQQEKLFELLAEVVPRLSRLGHLWDLGFGPYPRTQAASRLGIEVLPVPVQSAEELTSSLQALARRHVQALLVPGHPLLMSQYRPIAEFARAQRLPSISAWRQFPEAGGLMSYWSNVNDVARRAGRHVDKVLRGAKPADVPIEQPTTFEFVINLKTARALGLTLPPALLMRADEVIQ
jgi:putative ABC transport system substrate-binding protein